MQRAEKAFANLGYETNERTHAVVIYLFYFNKAWS